MIVDAIVRINLSRFSVDRLGSIKAAVADDLDVDDSQLVDLDDWVWQYESNDEYAWADARTTQPLTGEPWEEGGEA